MGLAAVTTEQFESQVLRSAQPVLVDFFATWCGPCRALTPVLERLAREFEGRVQFVKVDIDAEPDLAGKFQVESVPTLILFKGGKAVEQLDGAPPAHHLQSLLREHCDPKSAATALNAPWLRS